MKQLKVLITISFIYLSCNSNYNDKDSFGKNLMERLLNGEVEKVKEVYLALNDTSQLKDTMGLRFIRLWNNYPELFESYIKGQDEEIKNWTLKLNELGIKQDITYLRTEIDTFKYVITSYDGGDYKSTNGIGNPYLKIFFLKDTNEYFFCAYNSYESKNGWKIKSISAPTSIALERQRIENTPYTPYGLKFTDYNWEWKNANGFKSFSNFFITLSNKTPHDYDYLKYKMTITCSDQAEPVFSKTIEINEKIFSNDILKFEVIHLRDYYVGVDVRNSESFSFDIKVLDAKPRHNE
jgi:hypothetical protein